MRRRWLKGDPHRLGMDPAAMGPWAGRVLVALAILGVALLAWHLRLVLLLFVAAVLIAVILRKIGGLYRRALPFLPEGLSIVLAFLTILGTLVGLGWLMGSEVRREFSDIAEQLPLAYERLVDLVGQERVDEIGQEIQPTGAQVTAILQRALAFATSLVGGLLLAVLGGIYLALEPNLYRRGGLRLLWPSARPMGRLLQRRLGDGLSRWLVAQLISMTIIGIVTYIGLTLIGVPSALALALLAGLLEFIPVVGPIIAAIPGILIALTVGFDTFLLAILVYLLIQQFEGNVLAPLVLKRAVHIPPAVTLFSLFLFGSLFGPVGVVLGGPLTVLLFITLDTLLPADHKDENGREQDEAEPRRKPRIPFYANRRQRMVRVHRRPSDERT